jgi:hypothetical protein
LPGEEDQFLKIVKKFVTRYISAVTFVMAACLALGPVRADQSPSLRLEENIIRAVEPGPHGAGCCSHLHVRLAATNGTDDKPWKATDIMSGEELSKVISSGSAARPVIFQVGIEALYREAHIPDSIFAGPAAEPEGLALLKSKSKTIPRSKEIVIYCGCCPWKDCPNIKPAFVALQQLGFKKVKLLNIPTDFHQDWVNKGFPTVRS